MLLGCLSSEFGRLPSVLEMLVVFGPVCQIVMLQNIHIVVDASESFHRTLRLLGFWLFCTWNYK